MSTKVLKPTYNILGNGLRIPGGFNPEKFEDALTYIPEPGDVFICTYPKCGTTWTQCILHLLLNKGRPLNPGQRIFSVIPHLEYDGKDAVLNLPKPRVMKTHLPYAMLPKNKNAKYIYVVRNPKDCCVSFFYHTKRLGKCYDFVEGKFEDYFELFLAGEVDFGDYFHHLLSYLPHKDDPNMLFLFFEEMKSDIQTCIQKLGQFLGEPFIQSCEDPNILEKVIHNCSFESMEASPSFRPSILVKGSPGFIRKGEVGDWKNHFTGYQTERMNKKFYTKLGGTDAEHFWEKYNC